MTHTAKEEGSKSSARASLRWITNVSANTWSPTQEQLDVLFAQETPEEAARIRKFRKVLDVRRAIAARLSLRKAASLALGKDSTEIAFGRTKGRKPFIKEAEAAQRGLNANVSHHGDWVVLGMEERGLVGVDVTTTGAPRANLCSETYFEAMGGAISKKELALVHAVSQTEEERYFAFFVLWALKEAYSKAVGVGTALPFERLEMHVSPELLCLQKQRSLANSGNNAPRRMDVGCHITAILDNCLLRRWDFELYYLDDKHVMAVAVGPHSAAVQSYRTAMKELRSSSSGDLVDIRAGSDKPVATNPTTPLLPPPVETISVLDLISPSEAERYRSLT